MKITKVEKETTGYETNCPRCDKKITGVSIKQLNHNYKMHKLFCDKTKLQEELINGIPK